MKTAAELMVIVSSFIAAFLIIRREHTHCNNLTLVLRLIQAVKNRAIFYQDSFQKSVEVVSECREFHDLDFLSEFSKNTENGLTPPDAWEKAVREARIHLTTPEKDVLVHFGKDLCSCSREKIEEYSDQATRMLEDFREVATENRNKKSKTTGVITVSAALILVLMFI